MKTRSLLILVLVVMLASGSLAAARQAAQAARTPAPDERLTVTFLDVGQGDAALLRGSDDFDILIDGGRTSAGDQLVDFLKAQDLDDIDLMIASHADADHIGGLLAVLEDDDLIVETIYYNGHPGTTALWDAFIEAAAEDGLVPQPLGRGDSYTWGLLQATVIHPAVEPIDEPDQNDVSVVLRLEHGEVSFLFTGDIDRRVEAELLGLEYSLDSDILKVSHHGSDTGSSAAFLEAVSPEVAVISVGENSYGHPAPEVLGRLEAVGAEVLRTDELGHIVITSNGYGYAIGDAEPEEPHYTFLPFVMGGSEAQQPPIETPAPTQPPAREGNLALITVHPLDPEWVEFQNQDEVAVDLRGWTLRDRANHTYTFPAYQMAPDEVCRVYTDLDDPLYCGFNWGSKAPIWNNDGDCAYLFSSRGTLVSEICYP